MVALNVEEPYVEQIEMHQQIRFYGRELWNFAIASIVLLVQIWKYLFDLRGKKIMDVDPTDILCGVLLIAIGIVWCVNKSSKDLHRGVIIALTSVAVFFGVTLIAIHSESIVFYQTSANAVLCHGVDETTVDESTIPNFNYCLRTFCTFHGNRYIFDVVMISCGVVIVVDGILLSQL